MREIRSPGSVRGAARKGRPYRDNRRVLSLSFSAGGQAPPSERAQTRLSHRAPQAPRVHTRHASSSNQAQPCFPILCCSIRRDSSINRSKIRLTVSASKGSGA